MLLPDLPEIHGGAAAALHWTSAVLLLAVFVLYRWRSVDLQHRDDVEQEPAAHAYRRGLAVLLATFVAGLTARAAQGVPFEWFHALILSASLYTLQAQARLGFRRSPT